MLREFKDAAGAVWRVWGVEIKKADRTTRQPPFEWLCFDSAAGRKRLWPIPPGWENASNKLLAQYCKAAQPVPELRQRTG